jgi:hypothetical protein
VVPAVINAVAITLLEIVLSPEMSVIIAGKKGTLVVIVTNLKKTEKTEIKSVISVVKPVICLVIVVITIQIQPNVTSVANMVIWPEIVKKTMKLNIIQDMVLRNVIIAERPVIYHVIAMIMEMVEDVINVDRVVIMHVIVQNMVAVVTMAVVENALNAGNMDILPRIVMMIILKVNGARKSVIRAESLATYLVIVRNQEMAVVMAEDMVVEDQMDAIIVANLDIWPEIVITIARNAIAVENMVIFKEIAIRNQNAITVGVLVIKVEIAIYRKILKSAITVNRKDISEKIVLRLKSTRNHSV